VYKDNVYVSLSVGSLHHPMLDLEFQQTTWAHISVGSYRKMAQTNEAPQNTNVKWPPMCNHEIYDESQPIVF